MITAQAVKKMAKALGADAVGIGPIERWEGAPTQMDPRQIMPEAKSVIGMVFRVMRGSLRGIEEGTFFSNYSAMHPGRHFIRSRQMYISPARRFAAGRDVCGPA